MYGSDHCRERELRLHSHGMLIEVRQFEELGGFPVMKDGKDFEECRTEEDKCFFVGDARWGRSERGVMRWYSGM